MDVYFTSPWIPAEWIAAHDLQPRGIWHAPDLAAVPVSLSAGACAFAEAVFQLANMRPDTAFILPTTCDQLRRGFDTLTDAGRSRIFLFNLPVTWQSATVRRLYRIELERLSRFLVTLGGQQPSTEGLRSAIQERNRARSVLLELAGHSHSLDYARAVSRYHWDGTAALPACLAPPTIRGVRLALAGGPLPVGQWPLFEVITRAGGSVVLNATEAGERSLTPALGLGDPSTDPATLLADHFFDHCVDVFQRPNTRLYTWLADRLVSRQVQGLLLWHHVNCDLWRAEIQSLRDAFNLPVLPLDADEAQTIPPRLRLRIQAFIESLR